MIVKILFLIAALRFHDYKEHPVPPTILYCAPILLFALLNSTPIFHLFVHAVIMVSVVFMYFLLLTKFSHGIEYYLIMAIGAVILLFVV